jgi:hypothetical protein
MLAIRVFMARFMLQIGWLHSWQEIRTEAKVVNTYGCFCQNPAMKHDHNENQLDIVYTGEICHGSRGTSQRDRA